MNDMLGQEKCVYIYIANSHGNLNERGYYIFCLSANPIKTFKNVFIHLSTCLLLSPFDQRNILGATIIC